MLEMRKRGLLLDSLPWAQTTSALRMTRHWYSQLHGRVVGLALQYSIFFHRTTYSRLGSTSLLSGYKLNRISWLENSCKSDCVLRA
jgi:hypothetical protein